MNLASDTNQIVFDCGLNGKTQLIRIKEIRDIIEKGGIIGFPTDTVYGLGCSPYNKLGIQQLLKIKQRSPSKGFAVLGSDIQTLLNKIHFDNRWIEFGNQIWPGNVTLISHLKTDITPQIHPLATGNRSTIACRIPGLAFTRNLVKECGGILVGTSANISGTKPLLTRTSVIEVFGNVVDALIFCKQKDGSFEMGNGLASTIIDLTKMPPAILRKGEGFASVNQKLEINLRRGI